MTEIEKRQDRSPVPSAFDYAPAPESREIVTLEDRYGLFIGGEWVEPKSGEYEATIPAEILDRLGADQLPTRFRADPSGAGTTEGLVLTLTPRPAAAR